MINIRPAIAIEQKNPIRTARSTVGTATEIADLLRLLFAKIGKPICPECKQEARGFTRLRCGDEVADSTISSLRRRTRAHPRRDRATLSQCRERVESAPPFRL